MSRYCPDCGEPLLNPKRCGCGWRSGKEEKEKPYPECCMVAGCKQDTDIAVHIRDGYVTRCAWHYTEDLRRVNKHQMRIRGV